MYVHFSKIIELDLKARNKNIDHCYNFKILKKTH